MESQINVKIEYKKGDKKIQRVTKENTLKDLRSILELYSHETFGDEDEFEIEIKNESTILVSNQTNNGKSKIIIIDKIL